MGGESCSLGGDECSMDLMVAIASSHSKLIRLVLPRVKALKPTPTPLNVRATKNKVEQFDGGIGFMLTRWHVLPERFLRQKEHCSNT